MGQLSLLGVGGPTTSPPPPPPPGAYLYDTFTDTDGTSLDTHTMDVGSGWTDNSEQWTMEGDQAEASPGFQALSVASADAGHADATGSVSITIESDGVDAAFVFRHSDDNNYLMAYCRGGFGFFLFSVVGGSIGELASTGAFEPVSGVPFVIQVVTSGDSITATVNGGNALVATSIFNQTATRWGLACQIPGTTDYDDFLVAP